MPAGGSNPNFPHFICTDKTVERGLNDMADALRILMATQRVTGAQVFQNGSGIFSQPDEPDNGILFFNGDSNAIPPYGICLLNGNQANGTACVAKSKRPDTYGCQTNWILNGPAQVSAEDFGNAQAMFGIGGDPYLPGLIVAYDPADGTPAAGQRWGPRNGTYLLKKSTGGFVILGVYDSTNNLALATPEPMLLVRGTIASDAAPDSNSTLTVYTGAYGSEASTSQTISNVRNASDCTIKSGSGAKIHAAMWVPDNQTFQFVVGRTA